MTAVDQYLQIPKGFGAYLGGLRWSDVDDAIVLEDGRLFVFGPQLALFIEGFGSVRSLIPFGYVLHLLRMLGHGEESALPEGERLLLAYRQVGRPARNAGVLCAVLCKHISAAPGEISAEAVCRQFSLRHLGFSSASINSGDPFPTPAFEPPLSPSSFLDHVRRALRSFTTAELEHWLRHGGAAPTEEAERLAAVIELPKTLGEVVDELLQSRRLASAIPFVPQMVSALTIPPRRLARSELPIGGYADIGTRGRPEQLLPAQLALDEIELTRRLAENELLYFRREEPPTSQREKLILLLDQGVRTWGIVRALLSAATLALVKLANRRRNELWLAGTCSGGHLVNALDVRAPDLAELVGASDLSANPGLALETVLEAAADQPRDIVLLTHPRNLDEYDLAAASRRISRNTRLFSVAADAHGHVELGEMLRGGRRVLSRIRVDLAVKQTPSPTKRRSQPESEGTSSATWTGDVERYGYPFWFGLIGHDRAHGSIDFDHDGTWVFVVQHGRLHAARTDGTRREMLPRPRDKDTILSTSQYRYLRVLGAVGGFCLICQHIASSELVLAHYDCLRRLCKVFNLGSGSPEAAHTWCYDHSRHSINLDGNRRICLTDGVVRQGEPAVCELTPGPILSVGNTSRRLVIWKQKDPNRSARQLVAVDGSTGVVELSDDLADPWFSMQPLADGKPMLLGCRLEHAELRGKNLALVYYSAAMGKKDAATVILIPERRVLCSFNSIRLAPIALSMDGQFLARWAANRKAGSFGVFDVLQLHRGGEIVCSLERAKFHNRLLYWLRPTGLLVATGKPIHALNWKTGVLKATQEPYSRFAAPVKGSEGSCDEWVRARRQVPSQIKGEGDRLTSSVESTLIAAADAFGHVMLFEKPERLLCICFFFRDQLAIWTPDGTRWGPPNLIGGPPTPGALEKIGRLLLEAERTTAGGRS